jgi:FlaA1/EpsC-like NDP-sugar epimerase
MLKQFARLPRHLKSLVIVCADFVLLPFAFWSAIALRLGSFSVPMMHWWMYFLPSVIGIPIFVRMGLYRAVIRYIEDRAIIAIVIAVTLSVLIFAGVLAIFALPNVPRGAILIYWVLAVVYISSSRFLARALLRQVVRVTPARQRVLIYGAGSAGRQLAMAMRAGQEYRPVAFIDDDPVMQGLSVSGARVYPPRDLARLVSRWDVSLVLLALPSASRSRRIEIINELESLEVEVRSVPGIADLVGGEVEIADVREVGVDELLGRDIVPPNERLLRENIAAKNVLVTGAGGSIGAELCRQIIRQQPRTLVLYELSEFALYSIESELATIVRQSKLDCQLISVLGSVQNEQRMVHIMRRYEVQTIYHAAAYKHVPIVEFNITEGLLNNAFGTRTAARAAIEVGAETFVLISTDKAVRPTNVMGASKRISELILQGYAQDGAVKTRFSMVRFGNVLGSSGSVVPLFRSQIKHGGPVTVTHPDINRYFMTIPEAAQLVIQAGAMGGTGQVFVLDMGQPIKIQDLARRMIHLSGFSVRDDDNPDGDIEIRFTGLRPGEKLYEELLIGEDVMGTDHPRIMMANESFLTRRELEARLAVLYQACIDNDHAAIMSILHKCVSGFAPENRIRDHLYDLESITNETEGCAVGAAPRI